MIAHTTKFADQVVALLTNLKYIRLTKEAPSGLGGLDHSSASQVLMGEPLDSNIPLAPQLQAHHAGTRDHVSKLLFTKPGICAAIYKRTKIDDYVPGTTSKWLDDIVKEALASVRLLNL